MVGIFYENDGAITQVTDRLEPFINKKNFIVVDHFPSPEIRDGYNTVPYLKIGTKEIYYKYIEFQKQPSPPTELELLKQENTLLKAQVQATSERTDFHEELIAELAMMIIP